jgi:hypothetical protein
MKTRMLEIIDAMKEKYVWFDSNLEIEDLDDRYSWDQLGACMTELRDIVYEDKTK